MQEVVSPEFDADIARLEKGIRQLKIQYDMFFAGSIPKQPLELRNELEKIIRRNAHIPIRKLRPPLPLQRSGQPLQQPVGALGQEGPHAGGGEPARPRRRRQGRKR